MKKYIVITEENFIEGYIKIESIEGANKIKVINDMLLLAQKTNKRVNGFNRNEYIVVYPDGEILCGDPSNDGYHRKEAILKQTKEKVRTKNSIKDINKLLEQFKKIDFNNYRVLLKWLKNFQLLSDNTQFNELNTYVIQELEKHKYKYNEYVGAKHIEKDKNKFARYIIGQCMSPIGVHPILNSFIDKWFELYE